MLSKYEIELLEQCRTTISSEEMARLCDTARRAAELEEACRVLGREAKWFRECFDQRTYQPPMDRVRKDPGAADYFRHNLVVDARRATDSNPLAASFIKEACNGEEA